MVGGLTKEKQAQALVLHTWLRRLQLLAQQPAILWFPFLRLLYQYPIYPQTTHPTSLPMYYLYLFDVVAYLVLVPVKRYPLPLTVYAVVFPSLLLTHVAICKTW